MYCVVALHWLRATLETSDLPFRTIAKGYCLEVERRQSGTPLAKVLLDELRAAVGPAHVCTSAEDLDRYSRCTIPWQRRCAAVIFPDSTEEVAAVIRAAAKHRHPVWPFSGGRNWGYGATLGREDGALVMVLRRMNRISEVNEQLAYAEIEPGVTYEQLNAHLKQHGHRLWVDCIDGTAHGSVIGNALDRGVGETPYGDHFGNLCGLEVVLPDGTVIRTGGSASSDSGNWHTHKWGVGPYLEGIFSQSNLGVVTKAGIWLMPEPESHNSYVFQIRDERHLPQVLDALRRLALQGTVTSKLHVINDFVSLAIVTQRIREEVPQNGPLSDADRATLRRKYGISPWSCGGGIYGTRSQVRTQRAMLRKALGTYGKLIFVSNRTAAMIERLLPTARRNTPVRMFLESVSGSSLPILEAAPHLHRILQGIPSEYFMRHAYYRNAQPRPERDIDPARDRCGLIWFAPIVPFASSQVLPYLGQCRKRFEETGFDFYVAMLLVNPRAVICLMAIIYDHDSSEETSRAQELYETLLSDMRDAHYQQYRAGLESWEKLFEAAPELQDLNHRIKRALDPTNILAPGRYGIG